LTEQNGFFLTIDNKSSDNFSYLVENYHDSQCELVSANPECSCAVSVTNALSDAALSLNQPLMADAHCDGDEMMIMMMHCRLMSKFEGYHTFPQSTFIISYTVTDD
jgi:hypothetical protein